ncbi:FHA domain-containing protein [Lysinimonas soli]|uniref:FHA domain-containing protein n=1 Tax=Lysinimonas soli TaxID=1074233 RepID=A0ABW0NQH9_9MICO
MGGLTLLVLRIAFLLLLWAFVFVIVYALRSDLFGQRARKLPAMAGATSPSPVPAPSPVGAIPNSPAPAAPFTQPIQRGAPHADATTPRRLVITSGPREGLEIDLPAEQLTIGRSSESGLVIRDDYTSTHHARLMLWNDQWVIQDLDSTNGTFVAGSRVMLPTPVPPGTPVTIGTTSFELRR